MKIVSKKSIAAMIAGTFMLAGTVTPFIAQASSIQNPSSVQCQGNQKYTHNRQFSPEKVAQHLSETFGIDQATILTYHANGMSFRDIAQASFLANAGGRTLEDIISYKTTDNNWRNVALGLGITKEQMRNARQNIIANGLHKKIGLHKQTTLDLLHKGYKARDIGIAAELAKNTGKPITNVLSLRKINNTWLDVATLLNVDKETFKKDVQELGYGFHHRGYKQHTEDNERK